jgi:hypothetical protein
MLLAAGLTWGVVASPVFGVKDVEVDGAVITGTATVLEALDLPATPPNAFTLSTDTLIERLLALPAVARADVRVGLPGTLLVTVEEREPVLAWRSGASLFLVARGGRIIADAAVAGSTAVAATADGLSVVTDRRTDGSAPVVGGLIDALDLDVATRLLSLVPADVGSAAPALEVGIDDADGWTLLPAVEDSWTAVFGFFGLEIRQAGMIPEQVRLLRSLLVGRENTILRVVLAGPGKGTFAEKPVP